MSSLQRSTLRAALSIHQALTRPAPTPRLPELPDMLWDRSHRSLQAWQRATSRRWTQAARVVRQRLDDDLQQLIQELEQCRYAIHREAQSPTNVSLSDLIDDLRSLEDEFDQVTINLRERKLSVTTEPIDLEGLELGPFSIALHWNRLSEHGPYRIVAEDPHPAHSNDEVTHPHVHDERLCEGRSSGHSPSLCRRDASSTSSSRSAGAPTYNPSSPYVAIENWQGVPCHDCGSLTGEEVRHLPRLRIDDPALTVRILVTTAVNAVVAGASTRAEVVIDLSVRTASVIARRAVIPFVRSASLKTIPVRPAWKPKKKRPTLRFTPTAWAKIPSYVTSARLKSAGSYFIGRQLTAR